LGAVWNNFIKCNTFMINDLLVFEFHRVTELMMNFVMYI
jgi:hypothetical protein